MHDVTSHKPFHLSSTRGKIRYPQALEPAVEPVPLSSKYSNEATRGVPNQFSILPRSSNTVEKLRIHVTTACCRWLSKTQAWTWLGLSRCSKVLCAFADQWRNLCRNADRTPSIEKPQPSRCTRRQQDDRVLCVPLRRDAIWGAIWCLNNDYRRKFCARGGGIVPTWFISFMLHLY